MAAVDLEDLVEDLQVQINQPGTDQFPTVSTEEWVNYLRVAFWNAHLDGLMSGWTESEGFVSKINDPTAAAMSRDQQQLIVLYAYIDIIKNQIMQINTLFRAQAGSVEYEVQKSAQVYKAILDDLQLRLNRVVERLSEDSSTSGIVYIDTYAARQAAIAYDLVSWVGN